LAYQPPASSTFLSQQTSHQQPAKVLFSQNKPAPAISHQPTEQASPNQGCDKNLQESEREQTFRRSTRTVGLLSAGCAAERTRAIKLSAPDVVADVRRFVARAAAAVQPQPGCVGINS
jgi:hypothetical protein